MNNGSIFLARRLIKSEIFEKPSDWFKIWVFILLSANYKDSGHFKKGELFTSYSKIHEATLIKHNTIDHCIRWLKKSGMIQTKKTVRGFYVKVMNYSKYQELKSDTEKQDLRRQLDKKDVPKSEIEAIRNSKSGDTKSDTEKQDLRRQKQKIPKGKATRKATDNEKKSDTIHNKDNTMDIIPDNNINNIIPIPAKETQSVSGKEFNEIIDLFKTVNPIYEKFFKNKTQRKALENVISKIGAEKTRWVISVLHKTNAIQYAPTVTTPIQLENKLGLLIAFFQKEKSKDTKNKIANL